jgi:hypothetical protein
LRIPESRRPISRSTGAADCNINARLDEGDVGDGRAARVSLAHPLGDVERYYFRVMP